MLLAEQLPSFPAAGPAPLPDLWLRIDGTTDGEPPLRLSAGKSTIGSGPRSTLRIDGPGVHPLHCLVVCGAEGVRVRRWAADTLLNGDPFDEATLAPGDRLRLGEVELEVVGPAGSADQCPPARTETDIEASLGFEILEDDRAGDYAAGDEVVQADRAEANEGDASVDDGMWAEAGESDADFSGTELAAADRVESNDETNSEAEWDAADGEPWPAAEEPDAPGPYDAPAPPLERITHHTTLWADELEQVLHGDPASADPVAETAEDRQGETRCHDLRTATDLSRARSRKLLTALRQNRVDFLELADRLERLEQQMAAALPGSQPPSPWLSPGTALEPADRESAPLKDFHTQQSPHGDADDDLVDAQHAELRDELASLVESQQRLVQEKTALAEELLAAQEQLAAVETERAAWDRQRSDWQHQLAEWETRLAEHVERIEQLEQQLVSLNGDGEARAAEINSFAVPGVPDEPQAAAWDSAPAAPVEADHPESAPAYDWSPRPAAPASYATPEIAAEEHEAATPAAVDTDNTHFARLGDDATADDEAEAFAHLRELSIWRQGPPSSDSPEAAEAQPTDEDPPTAWHDDVDGLSLPSDAARPADEPPSREAEASAEASAAEPASFIERYSHLFADDDQGGPPNLGAQDRPAPVDEGLRKPRTMGVVRSSPSDGPIANEEAPESAEESIEDYMAKLLQRVRGDGPQVMASQANPATAGRESASPAAASSGSNRSPATEPGVAADPPPAPISRLSEIRRHAPAPEQPGHLEALRALANESTRRAIGVHASRTHRRHAMTKVIVATLAGVTSLWLMLDAPDWRDLQFISACVSLLAAAYWAGQTYQTLVESVRANSYSGPDYDPRDAEDPFHPGLPIDVDDR